MNMEQLLLAASEGLDLKRQRGRRSSGGGLGKGGRDGERKRGRRLLAHAAARTSVTHGHRHRQTHSRATHDPHGRRRHTRAPKQRGKSNKFCPPV